MLPILAFLAMIQVPIEQPPRLRTVLDNGAKILVERVPNAKSLVVDLFASSRGTEESPINNGLRHLLEHLIAKGPKGDLDLKLETAGGFLRAETQRDEMQFKLTLPPGQLALGLQIVAQLMQMPVVSSEIIQREGQVIAQEAALQDDPSRLSVAAWTQTYGDKGLDVLGNLDVIRNATPAMLEKIHRVQFSGSNLAITVVGDVELDAATKACAEILSKAPTALQSKFDRGKPSAGDIATGTPGEALALPTFGWRSPMTAARIAAAFALASETDNCFVICTPSANAGLVTFGRSSPNTGLKEIAAKAKANELFIYGRSLAQAWVKNMLATPEGIAEVRGQLLVQQFDLKPETLLENLETMTPKNFADAIQAFSSIEAIVVEGK
jgi:predicted Zn-dependent peptidase